MVVTRSQADATERDRRELERRELDREFTEQDQAVEQERRRRLSLDPPASPAPLTTHLGAVPRRGRGGPIDDAHGGPAAASNVEVRPRARSPTHSVRSQRSTTSTAIRARMAELEAEEKLAALKKKELEIEADLVRKRLAVDMAAIQDDQESLHEETSFQQQKVDAWLKTNTAPLNETGEGREPSRSSRNKEERQLRFNVRDRSTTPIRSRSNIDALTEVMEKLARPRMRCPDLPAFTGTTNEWLTFKAAFMDTTKIYQLTPSENLQRLRTSLKGEARDIVAALLYSASDPEVIMKTLEQCFGRPEIIIDRAIDDLKKLPKPGSSAMDLNNFAIKLQNVVCVFRSLGRHGYLFNPMLAREALEKLSPHIKSRWCDYANDHEGTADPEIVMLSRFLMREADRALKYSYAPSSSASPVTPKRPNNVVFGTKKKTGTVYTVTEEQHQEQCPSCGKAHKLPECSKFQALPVDQRWELVKENKLCFKCITKRHRRINCKAKPCGVNKCPRSHHPTLHQEERPEERQDAPRAPTQASAESVLTVATPTANQTVLLKMCPVTVVGPRGEIETHALLDEGATITLIDEALAKGIGAEGPALPLRMRGVNTTQQEDESQLVTVHLRTAGNELHRLRARTIKNLKLLQQSIPSTLLEQDHLQDLPRDEVCYDKIQPGILVGADHWEYIVSQELRVGKPNQPAASRTQLGWVIHGTVPRGIMKNQNSVLHVYTPEQCVDTSEQQNQRLHDLVEHHFTIEALGVAHKPRVSDADLRATKIVEQTIKKTEKGYEVGLPWKEDNPELPPSYNMALRRLLKIEQKMDADPVFAREYTRQIDNLLQKGYAEKCDGTEKLSPVCWYLPHFAVQNPNKPGKQRLVFDAAAKSRGLSLNNHLLEGPDLLMSLPGILFRFRERRIAITADVQEMFLQIKIRQEDQPAQQFLWRGAEREKPPQHFKMTSMIFGAASSPFMAHFVRDYNARAHAQTYPLACEAITHDHYMDDLVASYEDEHEAYLVVSELRTVHAAAGFTLRGWSTNDVNVLRDVPEDLRATTPNQLGGSAMENKILGLYWNADRDELGFNTSMNRVPAEVRARIRAPTKREALSAVMSIYDPLGLLSYCTIRAKIVLQSLWRLKISWDEPIPTEENELFASWLGHLSDLSSLRLERRYTLGECQDLELHILCDASEQAYAAVAYWRVTQPDGNVSLSLVAAKSKVAPKRAQTIPRLELQAAVIGARLASTIKKEHRVEVRRTVYWTDSMTVIHWVRHDARRYTPYVAHRLGELSELTHREEWRWVPTDENIADDATRFASTPISAEDRWFKGPDFLRRPESEWPAETTSNENNEETLLHAVEEADSNGEWLPDPARFSKYETLVRTVARVLAFVDKCRGRATNMENRHVEEAERVLLRKAQKDSFPEELQRMKTSQPLSKSSRLFKLDPVLVEGILRVRGRIGAATAPVELKQPIILDGRHRITRLIVLREHCAAGHANRERVTNDLRQRYWIIHLRPTVRTIEKHCALCKVRRTKPQVPVTGDLPRARLEPYQRPFSYCGADYFGPMIVKVGRRREKRWGALFTCLTTRAVHLETVPSLSTSSAIMALRRMAARRGWPRVIYSDNATNYRGADTELRAAYAEWAPALQDEGMTHRMEWRFIPPGAPNQGGAWERLVRSVKVALLATLNEKEPTEEVLSTLLTEAEFSINARPLTHVSVSHRDPEALTPNHFLLGSSTGLPSNGPCSENDRRAWRASLALADHFWRRWVREYLPTLVPRGEPTINVQQIQSGDVVIIVDHTLPRNVWPRGIVERTYKGPDGVIRVADVRTKTGIFKRPVRKLVVLVRGEATRATPGGGNVTDAELS